jgi:hypothetical protein|tara:strand:- start:351 stop:500 length:150 start_codon:yes stop_codon:yes gene_type:complete
LWLLADLVMSDYPTCFSVGLGEKRVTLLIDRALWVDHTETFFVRDVIHG